MPVFLIFSRTVSNGTEPSTSTDCFSRLTEYEVTPVVKIDGEIVNDGKVGPITKKLQEGFEKYIESKSIN